MFCGFYGDLPSHPIPHSLPPLPPIPPPGRFFLFFFTLKKDHTLYVEDVIYFKGDIQFFFFTLQTVKKKKKKRRSKSSNLNADGSLLKEFPDLPSTSPHLTSSSSSHFSSPIMCSREKKKKKPFSTNSYGICMFYFLCFFFNLRSVLQKTYCYCSPVEQKKDYNKAYSD